MSKFLNKDVVKAALTGNGSRFISVTFEKVNGDVVKRAGQRASNRRVGNAKGKAQTARMAASDQIWLDYPVEKVSESGRVQRGFSFNSARVVQINVDGQNLTANG